MPIKYNGFGPDVRMMVLLLENGRMKRSSFSSDHGMNHNTAKAAFERLEKAGLALLEAVGDRRETTYWKLSDKGVEVANIIKKADDMIFDP